MACSDCSPSGCDEVTLRVPGKTTYLDVIRAIVVRVSEKIGFSEDAAAEIELAVDEACTNVITHGYSNEPSRQPIDLQIQLNSKAIMIYILDHGRPFSPTEFEARDIEEQVKERAGHGLGIYIIKRFMDQVEHKYRPGIGNELKLVRYLNATAANDPCLSAEQS